MRFASWAATARPDEEGCWRTRPTLAATHNFRTTLDGLTVTFREAARVARAYGEAIKAIGVSIQRSTNDLERWLVDRGLARVVVKRLRHGREHRRLVYLHPRQPSPWKIAR